MLPAYLKGMRWLYKASNQPWYASLFPVYKVRAS